MQSGSASYPIQLVQRTRAALPGGILWTSILVFLLTLAMAKSIVTAQWVVGVGIEVVPLVAIGGAILMGLLALTPINWAAGVAVRRVLGVQRRPGGKSGDDGAEHHADRETRRPVDR